MRSKFLFAATLSSCLFADGYCPDSYESGNVQAVIATVNFLNGIAPLQNADFATFLALSSDQQKCVARQLENAEFLGYQEALQEELFQINSQNIDLLITKKDEGTHVFGYGVYDQIRQKRIQDYNPFRAINETGFLGLTKTIKDINVLGALGYGYTHVNYDHIRSKSRSNNFMGDIGISLIKGRYQLAFDWLFLANVLDQKREIPFFQEIAYSSHAELGTKGEVYYGISFKKDDVEVTPFERFGYLFLWETPFSEHGANGLDLQVASTKLNMTRNQLGLDFKYHYSQTVTLDAKLSWVHEQRYSNKYYDNTFIGTQKHFFIHGYLPTRDLFAAELMFKIVRHSWTGSMTYSGSFGRQFQENAGRLQLSHSF